MDVLKDILDIKEGFIHNLPIVVKLKGKAQDFFAVVLNPTADYLLVSPVLDVDGQPKDVRAGEKIEVATKIRGILWSGFCDVVEVLHGDFEGIWLTYPSALHKVQRRNFMRVAVTFPLVVQVLENDVVVSTYKGYCYDLSGEGICLNLDHSLVLYEDQTARVQFLYKSLDVDTQILPVYSMKQGQFFRIGCKFEDIDDAFSDKIHKFVVNEQIQMKKGGII